MDHLAMDIGQAHIPAAEPEGELFVVNANQLGKDEAIDGAGRPRLVNDRGKDLMMPPKGKLPDTAITALTT